MKQPSKKDIERAIGKRKAKEITIKTLEGGLPSLEKPKSSSEQSKTVSDEPRTPVRGDDRTAVREDASTPVRPYARTGRKIKRHPFQIYEDQLERLKLLKRRALLEGKDLSMSEVVRSGIDEKLKELEG